MAKLWLGFGRLNGFHGAAPACLGNELVSSKFSDRQLLFSAGKFLLVPTNGNQAIDPEIKRAGIGVP